MPHHINVIMILRSISIPCDHCPSTVSSELIGIQDMMMEYQDAEEIYSVEKLITSK